MCLGDALFPVVLDVSLRFHLFGQRWKTSANLLELISSSTCACQSVAKLPICARYIMSILHSLATQGRTNFVSEYPKLTTTLGKSLSCISAQVALPRDACTSPSAERQGRYSAPIRFLCPLSLVVDRQSKRASKGEVHWRTRHHRMLTICQLYIAIYDSRQCHGRDSKVHTQASSTGFLPSSPQLDL